MDSPESGGETRWALDLICEHFHWWRVSVCRQICWMDVMVRCGRVERMHQSRGHYGPQPGLTKMYSSQGNGNRSIFGRGWMVRCLVSDAGGGRTRPARWMLSNGDSYILCFVDANGSPHFGSLGTLQCFRRIYLWVVFWCERLCQWIYVNLL